MVKLDPWLDKKKNVAVLAAGSTQPERQCVEM